MGITTALGIDFVGAFVVSLITTFIIVPWLIPRLEAKRIVGRDINKPGKPEVAEMGGIAVVIGFFAGVGALLAINGIEENNLLDVNLLYATLSAILGAAFVGIMDDLFDLRQAHKAFLPFVLALPLGATVNQSVIIPHIITLDFGAFMVIAAAFAITCAANAANMLEGFNGLGTGLGIIMSLTLVILSIQHDRMDGVYLLIPLLGALVAFLWFNKYPAIVFPGDTMMLFMGATIAAAGILSNLHVQTIFIFLPMIVEFFLKLRSDFKAKNYSSTQANGRLRYEGRIESLTHVFMKHMKVTEKSLVAIIWSLEIVMCVFVIVVDSLIL